MGSVSFYHRLDVFPLLKENRYLAFVLCRRNRFRPLDFTGGFRFGGKSGSRLHAQAYPQT